LQNQLIRAASTPANADDEVELRKKETDEVQLRRDGALNQFINELSSNIHGRRYSEAPNAISNSSNQNDSGKSAVQAKSDSNDKIEQNSTIENNNEIKVSDNSTANESERNSKSDLLAKPSHFVTVIEVKESSASAPTSSSTPVTANTAAASTLSTVTTNTTTTSSSPSSTSSFKAIRSGYENVIIENNKRNSNLMNEMDRSSNTTSFNSVRPSAPPIALLQDAKKKIPPR
jgi:hypothetical protein